MRKLLLLAVVLGAGTLALVGAVTGVIEETVVGSTEPEAVEAPSYPRPSARPAGETEPSFQGAEDRQGVSAGRAAPPGQAVKRGGFFVGFSDNAALRSDPASAVELARKLGARAFRVILLWEPGQSELRPEDAAQLERAAGASGGMRIVLAVHGVPGTRPPLTSDERDRFCGYVQTALARLPDVRDVVIWNEPNKQHFWRPQFAEDGSSAAPRAYLALLARCWDALHEFRPQVNVIAPATSPRGNDRPDASSNISHSPGNFIRKLGEAYRESRRQAPIFDTVGHHAYGEHAAEPPSTRHELSSTISLGDWEELMQALWDAFQGTQQPIPGECGRGGCVSIWYLETGFQTRLDPAKAALYHGSENERHAVPPAGGGRDHTAQLTEALRLAACQPYVEAIFNFLLWDEADLVGWQSAPLWADRTPKGSFETFRAVAEEGSAGRAACSSLPKPPSTGHFEPERTVEVMQVAWAPARAFDPKNRLWRFRIRTAEDATHRSTLNRLSGKRAVPVLRTSGELRRGYLSFVTFPSRQLAPGRYRVETRLTSEENRLRTSVRRGPVFRVKAPAKRR